MKRVKIGLWAKVLLLLKREFFGLKTWLWGNGTEARTGQLKIIPHLVSTCWTRNGRWRRSSTITWWRSFRSQWALFFSVNYIFTFQAGLGGTETHFKEVAEQAKTEPLKMEHFHLSLGLWGVGILISIFCFLAEIINHHVRKSKTVVPLTPSVTQPTPE